MEFGEPAAPPTERKRWTGIVAAASVLLMLSLSALWALR